MRMLRALRDASAAEALPFPGIGRAVRGTKCKGKEEPVLPLEEKLLIEGGYRLEGEIEICGGKNPALGVIAAAVLCDEACTLENVPDIEDVHVMIELIRRLGAAATLEGSALHIDPTCITSCSAPYDLSRKLRASSYLLGALLGKFGMADVPYPGGCEIGERLIDQHIKGIRALGATVDDRFGVIYARACSLQGAEIYFDLVTVGGTINIMLAACRASGHTVLFNAAKEPHVVDVANFLNSMGARIKGAGTDVIRIQGVDRLHGSTYAIIPDQIETGTLMIAVAATHGDVTLRGCIPTHMEALTAKLLEMGVRVDGQDDIIRIRSLGGHRAVNIKTQVYPGFPTDLQQPMTVLLCTARGTSMVTETIFEQRFRHLAEMRRMGARAQVMDRVAVIEGSPGLVGAPVVATDLRAGASLVIAGLMASGLTEITNPHFIDRGYEHLEDKLRKLGAVIRRERAEA